MSSALMLTTALGCSSQEGSCLYRTAHAYSPGEPGSERLTAKVVLPDGQEHSAIAASSYSVDGGNLAQPTSLEDSISGRVTESSEAEVVVDTCDPTAGCQPTLYRLAATAPGLALAVPVGRVVSATWSFRGGPWVFSQYLAVLDGAGENQNDGTRAVWLSAGDPSIGAEVAGLFRVERQELFCNPSPGAAHPCGGGFPPPDDYAFRFSAVSGGAEVTLATGQSGALTVATASGQPQHLAVHNLRSYQTERCDDYWNWAWWAAGHPGPNGDPE